jgi:hypothetical protein
LSLAFAIVAFPLLNVIFQEELAVMLVAVVIELLLLQERYLPSDVFNANVPDAEPSTTVRTQVPAGAVVYAVLMPFVPLMLVNSIFLLSQTITI